MAAKPAQLVTSPTLKLVGGTTYKEQPTEAEHQPMELRKMTKVIGDITAYATFIGAAVVGALPTISLVFTILWAAYQIYNMTMTANTPFAKWLGKFIGRKDDEAA